MARCQARGAAPKMVRFPNKLDLISKFARTRPVTIQTFTNFFLKLKLTLMRVHLFVLVNIQLNCKSV